MGRTISFQLEINLQTSRAFTMPKKCFAFVSRSSCIASRAKPSPGAHVKTAYIDKIKEVKSE